LSDLQGRVVLLDYSAVWCGPSNLLAHDIPAIASQLAAMGIAFSYLPVLIDGPTAGVRGNQQDALNYFNHHHLPPGTHVLHLNGENAALNQPLPGLLDSFLGYSAVPSDNFGNGAFPTFALIDAHGVVRNVTLGYGGEIDALVDQISAIGPDTGVQITSAPATVTADHDATIEFTTTGGVPAQCSFDDAPFAPCSSPYVLADLTDGDHHVAITTGAEADAVVAWTVITVDTTITSGPGSGFIPIFTFTGNGSEFRCWSDDEVPYPCESPSGVFDMPGGAHTFHVASVLDGVADATPATMAFTTQPLPTITLVPDNANPTASDPVMFTVTVTDATTGDPVSGKVQFYGPEGPSLEILLDASGTATFTEPAFFFDYDEYVAYLGDADHGAGSGHAHIDVQ
jgi:hypothetical protein